LLDLVFALAFPFSWSSSFLNVDNKNRHGQIQLLIDSLPSGCRWTLTSVGPLKRSSRPAGLVTAVNNSGGKAAAIGQRGRLPPAPTASPASAGDSYGVKLRRISQGVRARLLNRPFSCDVDTLCTLPSTVDDASTAATVDNNGSLTLKPGSFFKSKLRNVGHHHHHHHHHNHQDEASVKATAPSCSGSEDAQMEFTFGQVDLQPGLQRTPKAAPSKRKGSLKERFSLFRRSVASDCEPSPNEESIPSSAHFQQQKKKNRVSSTTRSLSQLDLSSCHNFPVEETASVDNGNIIHKHHLAKFSSSQGADLVTNCPGDISGKPFSLSAGSTLSNYSTPPGTMTTVSPLCEKEVCTKYRNNVTTTNSNYHHTNNNKTTDHGHFIASLSPVDNGSSSSSSQQPSSVLKQQRTLRRAKAVDLGGCSTDLTHHPLSSSPRSHNASNFPSSLSDGFKKVARKESRKPHGTRKAANDSILKKLIVAGGKAFSEDSSLRIMNSVASMVAGTRQEVATECWAPAVEERGRKLFFSHYDCHSICADSGQLLSNFSLRTSQTRDGGGCMHAHASGTATVTQPGSVAGSGSFPSSGSSSSSAAAAVLPRNSGNTVGVGGTLDFLPGASPMDSGSVDDGPSSSQAPQSPIDEGDGKCNALVTACPFFRGEIGGEPTRHVSLGTERYRRRWIVQDVSNSSADTALASDPLLPNSADPTRPTLTAKEHLETWHRIPSAAEACVLENLGNVYLGGRLCAYRQPQLVIEHVDHGAFYYRHCFLGKAHQNYFGIDENLGPVAISIARDKLDVIQARLSNLSSPYVYRIIIRLSDLSTFRGSIIEESLPSYQLTKEQAQTVSQPMSPTGFASGLVSSSSTKIPVKEILELVIPELTSSCLKLAVPLPRTEEMLLKLDEQAIYTRYKVGVLLCKANQCTEEHMYNNEFSTPAFEEFLDILGDRIRLKGFDKYKGGLDNKGDSTGTHSVYTTYQQYEIMFHVSTMLPFTPSNRQQLARKRHIGNDIVTIIFQEPGAMPFNAQTMRSHFQHVFIIVRAVDAGTDNVQYSIAVTRFKDVPVFGPPVPANYLFPRSQEFREFLLTKIINAENAVHKSAKFAQMAARTRREFMRELAENHCISHSIESSSVKITSKILGNKRKDRPKPKVFLEAFNHGAVVWDVQVLTELENFSLCSTIDCYLGISVDYLVMIERSSNITLFCTATHSVIGWTSQGNSLKLYYDHADVIILRTVDDDDGLILNDIITRLKMVTKGYETQEMILRHNPSDVLDFRIQYEGIVNDVDMYGPSWLAGLRQGSRIVEISKVSVASLTYPKMLEFLKNANTRVLVIPPLEDGSPRRGCEDPHCPAVRGEVTPIIPTDWVPHSGTFPPHLPGRSPPSYETVMHRQRSGTIAESLTGSKCKRELKVQTETGERVSGYSSKSLDELRSRRLTCYGDPTVHHDSGFDSTRNSADYQSTTTSSLSSEDRWYQSLKLQPKIRTKTLSSSSSGGSSDLSTEAPPVGQFCKTARADRSSVVNSTASSCCCKDPTTPAAEQISFSGSGAGGGSSPRNLTLNITNDPCSMIVKANRPSFSARYDAMKHTKLANYQAPPLPPKTYKNRTDLPALPVTESDDSPSRLHESAFDDDAILINTNSRGLARRQANFLADNGWSISASKNNQAPRPPMGDLIKCSSLVDLATRAIEGIAQVAAVSQRGSPELSSYNLILQASRRKIVLLEDRVHQLLAELNFERENKRKLEMEISRLSDENKTLFHECKAAKEELCHFTEWFCKTVENPSAYVKEQQQQQQQQEQQQRQHAKSNNDNNRSSSEAALTSNGGGVECSKSSSG
ncbi:Signal-induced proliferation-associated 1-like protein 2, partial [Trichinella britovi]